MSNYGGGANGRRRPNISQYLRELSSMPSYDVAGDDGMAFEDDLTLFTNTHFYDYDSGQNTDYQAPPAKPEQETSQQQTPSPQDPGTVSAMSDFSNIDFMSGDFNFTDFGSTYASPTNLGSFADNHIGNLQPLQPSPGHGYSGAGPQHHHQHQSQQSDYASHGPRTGDKRKASIAVGSISAGPGASAVAAAMPSRSLNPEEQNRISAEEDKRRRNTAASARFRQKKKQREQAMEKSAKEMNDKVSALENRISQLETENKWLKNLVMEKNDGKDDVANLLKEFNKKQQLQLAKGGAGAGKDAKPAVPLDEAEFGDETG